MSSIRDQFATVKTVLAADVANGATFTTSYPAGTTQLSFTAGLASSASYMLVNGNDRWSVGNPGIAISYGASLITITNNTGATIAAGSEILLQYDLKDGNYRTILNIPLPPLSTLTAADVVTEMRPGIAGTIEYVEFVSTIAVTTAAKLATLNLEIDTTDVTGGVLALTSAALTPKGIVIPGTAITANNVLTRDSKLSIEASAVTAFVEGEGFLNICIRPTPSNQY